jgi:LysR family nitrogen assimilation transcriptional regulator
MDTATVVIVHAVLSQRGIRQAARILGKPPSSVAAAVRRLETSISVPMLQRAGPGLVLTLEAERLMPDIALLASHVEEMMAQSGAATEKGISFKALARFCAVVEAGSIRRAAQRLKLGQPQLTRQIAQLEAAMGCALLVRGTGGSMATEAGSRLALAGGVIEELWARLAHAASGRFRRNAATLRLGSIIPLGHESRVAALLASLVAQWLELRPRQPLFASSSTAEDLLTGLKSGLYDVALLDTASVPSDMEGLLLARSSLALVGAGDAARLDQDLAALLQSAPIAVPSPRSGLRQTVTRLLAETLDETARERLRLIEIDSIPVILNLVLHHGFISVLPEGSVTAIRHDLRHKRLDPRHDLPLWLVWPKSDAGRQTGSAIVATLRGLGHAFPA